MADRGALSRSLRPALRTAFRRWARAQAGLSVRHQFGEAPRNQRSEHCWRHEPCKHPQRHCAQLFGARHIIEAEPVGDDPVQGSPERVGGLLCARQHRSGPVPIFGTHIVDHALDDVAPHHPEAGVAEERRDDDEYERAVGHESRLRHNARQQHDAGARALAL